MVQDVQYKADELVFQQGNARSAFLVVKQGEVGKLSAHCKKPAEKDQLLSHQTIQTIPWTLEALEGGG